MNRDINALAPVVADKCRALISKAAEAGIGLLVTSTLRTGAEQSALFAQGRRPTGEVNHIRRTAGMAPIKEGANRIVTGARLSVHQYGCAFDVALIGDGSPVWDALADLNGNSIPEYEEAGAIGETLGLAWGGRFGRKDLCHFEYTGGLSMAELQAGHRPADKEGGDRNAPYIEEEKKMEKAKAGLRSTEFYMALLGAVLPVLNSHLGLQIPISGVMGISGVVVSYILSRTLLKRG